MKAIIFLFLCVIVVSCKDSVLVEPNPPVVLQPKVIDLTISPSGEVLPYGSKVNISWNSINSTYCVLNGETVKTVDSRLIQLVTDTKYTILAINGNTTSDPVEKSIQVGDWTSSDLGLISYAPWFIKGERVIQDGKVYELDVSDKEKADKFQFALDGYYYLNGVKSILGWSISSPGRILCGTQDCYYSVSKTEFNRGYAVTYNSKPAIFEITYGRTDPSVPK